MNSQPIGVFDSGVGGLSVLKHIHTHLPHEDLLYFADSKHAPYGNQSPSFIIERACQIADFLIAQGAKALVVACNTATAAAVSHLREHYTLPIIGMEPAVKPAAAATKTGVVGVLATVGTLRSAQFAALLAHYGQHIQVVTQGCVGLVECVEQGALEHPATIALLNTYLAPLLSAHADTIVLGCTHYPFLKAQIQQIVGANVTLIDTGEAVAKQLARQLAARDLMRPEHVQSHVTIWSNAPQQTGQAVIARLWDEKNEQVEINMLTRI